eukprot:PhF_6_TR19860/c0_g1_i1/m.28947
MGKKKSAKALEPVHTNTAAEPQSDPVLPSDDADAETAALTHHAHFSDTQMSPKNHIQRTPTPPTHYHPAQALHFPQDVISPAHGLVPRVSTPVSGALQRMASLSKNSNSGVESGEIDGEWVDEKHVGLAPDVPLPHGLVERRPTPSKGIAEPLDGETIEELSHDVGRVDGKKHWEVDSAEDEVEDSRGGERKNTKNRFDYISAAVLGLTVVCALLARFAKK